MTEKYIANTKNKVANIIGKFGSKYITRGDISVTVSGDWGPEKIVIIEYDSLEQLHSCFNSPEYRAIAPLREKSTKGRAIAVEGIE